MAIRAFSYRHPAALALVCGLASVAAPAWAGQDARAELVHCGAETCIRLSGHRPSAAAAVMMGGRALAVAGGRRWQATVPLEVARTWPIGRGYALHVSVVDPADGAERSERVLLPPGALGSRHEIASLVIAAR